MSFAPSNKIYEHTIEVDSGDGCRLVRGNQVDGRTYLTRLLLKVSSCISDRNVSDDSTGSA